MAQCKYPMIRIEHKNIKVTGKDGHIYNKATIISQNHGKFKGYKFYQDEMERQTKDPNRYSYKTEFIPCGHCIGCRLDYSRQWATRCVLEAGEAEKNYFLTLTYDDDHIPRMKEGEAFSKYTGEIYPENESWQKGTLREDDLKKFVKDLRRHFEYHFGHTGIRFYACGEYGGQTERPHYHILLFNCPIPENELVHKFTNQEYQPIYVCDRIEKIWGKGLISIGQITWSSAAYVARYILKKQTGEKSDERYPEQGRIQEFTRMSRMPGIGRNFFERNKDTIYDLDEIIMKTVSKKTLALKPPKYYDKLYDLDEPERMAAIKDRRKASAIESMKSKRLQSTQTIEGQYEVEARSIALKIQKLVRPL